LVGKVDENIAELLDAGYIGATNFKENCSVPKRKSKNKPLTKLDKLKNLITSRYRILIENMNAKIKVFKIFSNKYRNRRKRRSLRMNLICGLINFDLKAVSV